MRWKPCVVPPTCRLCAVHFPVVGDILHPWLREPLHELCQFLKVSRHVEGVVLCIIRELELSFVIMIYCFIWGFSPYLKVLTGNDYLLHLNLRLCLKESFVGKNPHIFVFRCHLDCMLWSWVIVSCFSVGTGEKWAAFWVSETVSSEHRTAVCPRGLAVGISFTGTVLAGEFILHCFLLGGLQCFYHYAMKPWWQFSLGLAPVQSGARQGHHQARSVWSANLWPELSGKVKKWKGCS